MRGHSTRDGGLIWRALGFCREVDFWSGDYISQAPGLLEVLGMGAKISI
jgi:hypothetical protein